MRIFLTATLIVIALMLSSCTKQSDSSQPSKPKKMIVFTGIAPLKYLINQVGGDKIDVEAMVPPGGSPATWEPLPAQLAKLAHAPLYFTIGVPFEKQWIGTLIKNNPNTQFVPLQTGFKHRAIETLEKSTAKSPRTDPHSWLNPQDAIIMARAIKSYISLADPKNSVEYEKNCSNLVKKLKALDEKLEKELAPCAGKSILVFHPSYGYFCDRYHLTQIPIEIAGRKPSPQELSKVISLAKQKKIHTLLVQKQFSQTEAKTVAQAINGKVLSVNPLSENYMEMMQTISEAIRSECKK
ncbi:zinc ABC transporter substrate-binding protein [bacterium]|nr:zinc ABC transporter substrate-binding protein [bacterium]